MNKHDITKKIININYKNLNINGDIMNNYKFKEQILDKSKGVKVSFEIDEKLNSFNEVLENINANYVFISDDMKNIPIDESETEVLDRDIDAYFSYPRIFSEEERNEYKIKLLKKFNEINAIRFELKLLETKKNNVLKDFNISSAVKINDEIFKSNQKLAKTINDIKQIAKCIKDKEKGFVNDYNQFLLDIREGKIEEEDLGILNSIYTDEVINEYKINLLKMLVEKYLTNISIEELIRYFDNSIKAKEFLGELFPHFIDDLTNVGKDN